MSTARGDFGAATKVYRGRFRGNRWALRAAVSVVSLFVLFSILTSAWTEYLWFHEDVNHADTWGRIWSAKLTLLFGGGAFAFAGISLALLFAERIAPADAVFSRNDPLLGLRAFTARRQNFARNAAAGLSAIALGPAAMGYWQQWTMFRFAPAGGPAADGMFGKGVNFYMFRLPFMRSLGGWLFGVGLVALILTVIALVLNGAIRNVDNRLLVTPSARALVSALLAFVFLTRTLGFWYSRFALALSSHQRYDGVGYVDGKVRSPAYMLMALVSLICALCMIFNVFQKRWDLMLSVVTAWIVVAPLSLFLVPAIWQRFAVSNELVREKPALARHISATREAFQLDDVEQVSLKLADPTVPGASQDLAKAAASVENIRLWDVSRITGVGRDVVDSLQKTNPRYRINDVDVVPGQLDGKLVPLLSGVRELVPNATGSWVSRTLQYTHGFGVVAAPANRQTNGEPEFSLKDLPVVGTPMVTQPRVYFGERTLNYVVVNSATGATDIAGAADATAPKYAGSGGVELSSGLRRLAFGWKYRDLDLVVSKSVLASSRLITNRDIEGRVHAVAPFLHLDSDPYAVVHKGRILWIVEAYVASSSFPNSDRSSQFAIAPSKGARPEPYSYIRNSIRVVVDAYSGRVSLFRIEPNEQIAATYSKAFPRLFETKSFDAQYPGLSALVRYPSDLFNVRANLWGRFHVASPEKFYEESDRWSIGSSDARVLREPAVQAPPIETLAPPEYVVTDPKNEGTQAFYIQQSLVAKGTGAEAAADQRLRSVVFTQASGKSRGRLLSLNVPEKFQYDSPSSAGKRFSSDPQIGEIETNLGRGGSEVVNGQVQVVRVGNAMLYVRPLYVRAEDANKSRPRLSFVEVRYGNKIGFAPTLAAALEQVQTNEPAGSPVVTSPVTAGSERPALPRLPADASVTLLLTRAEALIVDADTALKKGDLGRYKALNDEIADLIRRARAGALK
jgi:uncharacterized protein